MELIHQPFGPWHTVATIIATVALILLLARGGRDRWRALARRPVARVAVIALSAFALALLAWSTWNPRAIRRGGSERLHLELLLDVSDSMRRDAPGWDRQRRRIGEWIEAQVAASPRSLRRRATAGVTTCGRGAVTAGKHRKLVDWRKAFDGVGESEFALGGDTDLAAGLRAAAERIRQRGGRGAVVLASDGHPTRGDTLEAARELGALGIPILVLPAEGSPPALALSALDLPPVVESDEATRLRGGIANQLGRPVKAFLKVETNPGLSTATGPHGNTLTTSNTFDLASDAWARFRPEITFDGYGLQLVEITLADLDPASERPPQRRRVYTQVKRPPRLLAIGDNQWLAALYRTDFEVIQKTPEELTPDMNLADVDAIIVSGVQANRFDPEVLGAFREATERGGAGFLFLNGAHPGAETEPSIIASYLDTPVLELLPVLPRKADFEPPERHVILMLDTSGSMGGWETPMKRICRDIISRLRESDKLDVIAFTVSANHLIKDLQMTEANKLQAIGRIDRIAIGGGTSPRQALDLLEGRTFVEGGLIFISDGGFSPGDISDSIRRRPDLRTTVFSCGNNSYRTLQKLADPIFVTRTFDPSKIEIPYFGKKEDNRFYDKESFVALPMPDLRRDDRLPLPEIGIPGAAFSRIKEDAVMVGVRPRLAQPILATRPSGAGQSGAWLSGLDGSWTGSAAGQAAVTAWLRRLIGFSERERYDIRLTEAADSLRAAVSVLPGENGRVPRVERLNARLLLEDGTGTGLRLLPDGFVRGQFEGEIPRPRLDRTQRAFLILSEEGEEALPGQQRIPLVLAPPRAAETTASREDWTHGLNESLLLAMTQVSGGAWHPEPGTHLAHAQRAVTRDLPLWPWLAVLGGLCLLGAVGVRRLTP